MTKDEALKLALEFLEQGNFVYPTSLATAIKEALALSESSTKCEETSHAQPDVDRRSTESKETFDQQEPVAITITGKLGNIYSFTGDYSLKKGDKVYTTPPSNSLNSIKSSNTLDAQRKPLSDERLELIGHADLAINNIYIFNGYGEEVPEGRTPIYAGYKASHGIKE